MSEQYITAAELRNMGERANINRTDALYEMTILPKIKQQAKAGNYFVEFQIGGDDWSIVNRLCDKIRTEHPGVFVKNERCYHLGIHSLILVRWDN